MIKTILFAASGGDADSAAFAAALALARPFAAHIDALHVRLDAAAIAAAMATDVGSGALTGGLIEQLERDAREREAAAHTVFVRLCGDAGLAITGKPPEPGPTAQWHVETGEETAWVASYGLAADLIVMPRPASDDAGGRSMLEAALLETGRPVLIPAASPLPASFERIAIAWKPTPPAARAVALALPFLLRAREIVVAAVEEQAGEHADADRLVRNLAWHGLAARAERLEPGPEGAAATLLQALAGRADLLVMGGYGRSRLREWVFGGFTRRVLADAPLPVLIAH
jgi:nucleotide-binding universal stress UspA family protein